jgi:hypothetical protein
MQNGKKYTSNYENEKNETGKEKDSGLINKKMNRKEALQKTGYTTSLKTTNSYPLVANEGEFSAGNVIQ